MVVNPCPTPYSHLYRGGLTHPTATASVFREEWEGRNMKLKKFDLSAVKAFLFEKGERVGMVVCAAIAVLVLGLGLMKAVGSSSTYANDFKKARSATENKMTGGPGEA